ncbi:MAG: hypothetical protein P1V35_07145 [Planctomycetota bacterium]|nr:hypothetical protein [Planctomycetota bacterium]
MNLTKKMGLGLGLASLLCSVSSAQTFTKLIAEGDAVPGGEPGELVTRIDNVDINNQGDWAVELDGSGDTASDAYTLVNGVIAFEEGTTTGIATPVGVTSKFIDSMDINDNGDQLFLVGIDLAGATDYIVIRNGVTIYQRNVSVCTAPGLAMGMTYTGLNEVWQNNNDQLLLAASVGVLTDQVMIKVELDPMTGAIVSETLLAMETDTLPGSICPIAGFSASKGRNGITDAGDVFYYTDDVHAGCGDTLTDANLYVNTTRLYNEGDAFPADMTQEFDHFSSAEWDMNSAGDFVFAGFDRNPDSLVDSWIFTSIGGVITPLAHEGDPVPASIGGPWITKGFGFGGTVPIDEDGNVLWMIDWDDTDTTIDTALMWNGNIVIHEGVTVIDGNTCDNVPNSDSEIAMSDDGTYAIAECDMTGGIDTVYMITDLDPGVGVTFCDPANANSTGDSTTLSGTFLTGGGIMGGQSDLHLECKNGVPAELGYFLVGDTSDEPGIVVSSGNLCLTTGPFYRYNVSGTTSNSVGIFNAAGVLENFAGTSTVGPVGMETGFDVPDAVAGTPQVITAGSTWHFQVWHRDTPAGVGTSNFSNGLSVTF